MILPTSYWPPISYVEAYLQVPIDVLYTTRPQRDHNATTIKEQRANTERRPNADRTPIERSHKADRLIEVQESFEKQTFRNRCRILDLQGREMVLTVPVKKVEHKQLTQDIEIAYAEPWQAKHTQALRSAYEQTPYFDYFWDLIEPIYHRQFKYLIDLNDRTLQLALAISTRTISPSGQMEPIIVQHTTDWSGETWTDKHPWQQELSILDRLFRDGY